MMILLALWAVWLGRRKRQFANRWLKRAALGGIALPFVANTAGWIFTEIGRQPWIVYGLMKTGSGVSNVPAADVAGTLITFVVVYLALGTVSAWLMARAATRDLFAVEQAPEDVATAGLVYCLADEKLL